MGRYIWLTTEGFTFQANSEIILPDIENAQVVGFSSGNDTDEAFLNLLKNEPWLIETNFDEIICYLLDKNFEKSKRYYYLKDLEN